MSEREGGGTGEETNKERKEEKKKRRNQTTLEGSGVMFNKKKEVIPFKEFMSPPATRTSHGTPLTSSIYSFLPPMTLMDFIPIHDPAFAMFLIGSSLIIGIALLEKIISGSGSTELSAILSTMARFAFPGIGFGALFWFLLQL